MTKPHHDQGFTLTETLVALLVTSLAMAAILTATTLVGRHYKKATDNTHKTREIASVQADIYAHLHPLEPIEGDDVIDTQVDIRYKCQKEEPCVIAKKHIRFKYISRGASYTTWPPKETIEGEGLPRLEALILQDEQARTVGVINFVSEQGKDCVFDMISRMCRKTIEAETTRNGSPDGQ